MAAIGLRAGLQKRVGPHRFRHTFATGLFRETKDLLLVQEQLGHSSVNTTAVYAKTDNSQKAELINKVDILNVRGTLMSTVFSKR